MRSPTGKTLLRFKNFFSIISKRLPPKVVRPLSREKLYSYWKTPNDRWNSPELYLQGHERSEFLVSIVKRYLNHEDSILEVGCNVGRNMQFLFDAGFRNLSAVEISAKALELLKLKFPIIAKSSRIYNSTIEDWVQSYSSLQFDLIFAMAVLEHLHWDSDWVFSYLSKMSKKYLVIIEDEWQVSNRHFPRNYKDIFENLGMTQLEEINCIHIPGLNKNFFARVFAK
ncbi:MAG: class I SAM-dependent methyltransferase [Nitrososphaeraceae archaeon]